jgi:hypothetical protein
LAVEVKPEVVRRGTSSQALDVSPVYLYASVLYTEKAGSGCILIFVAGGILACNLQGGGFKDS